ncbi:MAG: transglycosylase SLT domain-containing protein [Gammaproteobacteria bacterium]|nr:transglycosylase SLT domain-containing protein [Gammaproteobacteria bacterium]
MIIKKLCTGLCLVGLVTPAFGAGPANSAVVSALNNTLAYTGSITDPERLSQWVMRTTPRLARLIPNVFYRVRLLTLIYREAQRARLEPDLVVAVIQVESAFDRKAVSRTGALGLMQVKPFWIKELGHPEDNLFDVATNLRYGCAILRHYLDLSGNRLTDALAYYNGTFGETEYPRKVFVALGDRWGVLRRR